MTQYLVSDHPNIQRNANSTMLDIDSSSSGHRVVDIHVGKFVDEEDGSVTLNNDRVRSVISKFVDEQDGSITLNDDRVRSIEDGTKTPIDDLFTVSIRSLGSIGAILNNCNNDSNGINNVDLTPGACADIDDNISSKSFEGSSSRYGDDTASTSGNGKRYEKAEKQPILKSLLFVLLLIAGILSSLSGILYYPKMCAFANLFVIASIATVFVIYDTRMRSRHKLLIQSITRSEAIVNSLFPEHIRARILEEGNLVMEKSTHLEASTHNNTGNFLDATTTADDAINLDDTSNKSISGRNIDTDPIQLNSRENPVPPAPHRRTSSPKFMPMKRRKSNLSTASSNRSVVSDACGSDPGRERESYQQQQNHHHLKIGKTILAGSTHSSSHPASSKPIADYFPSATIMFADIVGFTSWASTREPVQVFELLETVYRRFDRIAKKKGVFKVETIGDCYVAATGLPNAMHDHAVAMASFARRCLEKMLETVADLEQSLGPGTADLGLRIGIHSGSCIGGVLRGAKSRYQLFGDTMNTASRMESTSKKNKIQLSEQTAELIMEAGKKLWVEPRGDTIFAKGKGELKTYWLTTERPTNLSAKEQLALPVILKMMAKADIDPGFIQKKKAANSNERRERLVDYHTNVLKGLLSKLAAMHFSTSSNSLDADSYAEKIENEDASSMKTFNEEAMEGILFPTSTKVAGIASTLVGNVDPYTIDDSVTNQLRELVSRVSRWHRDDLPFHSFEHASHTVLSITKLLAAIETAHRTTDTLLNKTKSMITHPLTQFVLVFAALVHDASDEDARAAERSTRRAWTLFFEPCFCDLRRSVCRSHRDYEFFRRLLGKSILVVTAEVTDFVDHRGNGQSAGSPPSERITFFAEKQEASNKALTIVEKLLRVSDVSYSLQHFLVFQKWNRLRFKEEYATYLSENDYTKEDPSVSWHKSELESFDDRIRLVRSLRDSGVCNKLADVYLNAAIANRREWERKGVSMERKRKNSM